MMQHSDIDHVLEKATNIIKSFFRCDACKNEFGAHMMKPYLVNGESRIVCGLCSFVKKLPSIPFIAYDQLLAMINENGLQKFCELLADEKCSANGLFNCQKCHQRYDTSCFPKVLACGHGICATCSKDATCMLCDWQQETCRKSQRFEDLYYLLFTTLKTISKLEIPKKVSEEKLAKSEGCCAGCKEEIDIKSQFVCITCNVQTYCPRCVIFKHRQHDVRDILTEMIAFKVNEAKEQVESQEAEVNQQINEYFEQVADFTMTSKALAILDQLTTRATSVEMAETVIEKCRGAHSEYIELALRFLEYHKKIVCKVAVQEEKLAQLLQDIETLPQDETNKYDLRIKGNEVEETATADDDDDNAYSAHASSTSDSFY